jgi:hypothetical protein
VTQGSLRSPWAEFLRRFAAIKGPPALFKERHAVDPKAGCFSNGTSGMCRQNPNSGSVPELLVPERLERISEPDV